MTAKTGFKFTKQSVRKIKATDKRQYFYDTQSPQLGLTVQPSGAKSFFVRATFNGVTKRIGLKPGRFPGVTPDLARIGAAKILADVAGGVNTIEVRKRQKNADITLSDALNEYLENKRTRKGLPLKPRTKTDYKDAMHESFKDYLEKPLHNITEGVIRKAYKIRSKQSPARFDNAVRVLKALFNWMNKVYDKGSYPINPTNMTSDEGMRYTPERKNKYIYKEQMPDWFDAVEQQPPHVQEYFEFLLLTGCRAGEAAFLDWKDIDMRTKIFTLRDTKNRRDIDLPIPDYLIGRLKQRQQKSGSVFNVNISKSVSKSHGGERHIYARIERAAVQKACDFEFTLHSLRNTFLTNGDDIAPRKTLKALVNHMSSDVTDGYITVSMDRMRSAQAEIDKEILNQANRYQPEFLTVVAK